MNRKTITTAVMLIVFALIFALQNFSGTGGPPGGGELRDDAPAMAQAFEDQRGDLWVESFGTVERTLSDDNEGSRHQRFIVRLSNDMTILISHNIDLAERVPLSVGDQVVFRGEYEWNHRGGVVHWTHHDPRGRHDGGWIRYGDTVYR